MNGAGAHGTAVGKSVREESPRTDTEFSRTCLGLGEPVRVAHVSTFPPLRCGIASFAADLIAACPNVYHLRYGLHYGQLRLTGTAGDADVHSRDAVASLARSISDSNCEVVSLQHEFGIWGGAEGEYIHSFLDCLRKPFLSVLHTTFSLGVRSDMQADIIRRLVRDSMVVVVLTYASKVSTEAVMGGTAGNVVVVPHGIPDFPYCPPPEMLGVRSRPEVRLVTPGFFREDKGLEVILHAVRELRDRGFGISYRIVGEPQRQFSGQVQYLSRIERLIEALELSAVVEIDARYVPLREQAAAIQAAHIGIFAYQDASHASSGTVPLVMGMGRPVVCTPFEYAKTKAEEGAGVFIADGFDQKALADAVERVIAMTGFSDLTRYVHERTRPWTWPTVGKVFEELYCVCAGRSGRP